MKETEKSKAPKIRFAGFTDDWEQRKLNDVFDTVTDYVANGSFKTLRENVQTYSTINFAYMIRLQDASNGWSGPWLYTDEKGYKFLSKSSLQQNDIIMSNVGSVGKFFQVPKLNKPMTLAPNSVLIKSTQNDNRFLYQMMLNSKMQSSIRKKTTPGVQSKINKTDFKKIDTFTPCLEEQRRIGTLFSNVDCLITLHQRQLDSLKKVKKSFLKKLFPKNGTVSPEIRFAGFTDDWEQRKLGTLFKKSTRKNIDLEFSRNQVLTASSMSDSDREIKSKDSYMKTYNKIEIGEMLFEGHTSKEFAFGRFVVDNYRPGIISHVFDVYTPLQEFDLKFLTEYIHNESVMRTILVRSTSNARMLNSLNSAEFYKQLLLLPLISEQKRIGDFLGTLNNLIALRQRKLDTLKKMKKALLQQMFI